MQSIEVVFEFDRPLDPTETSSLFHKSISSGFTVHAGDEGSRTIYVGKSTDHLPEIVDLQQALEYLEKDGQGGLQLRYGGIDILFSVNPDMDSADVNQSESFSIVGSVDGVHFRPTDIFGEESRVMDRVSDLVDAVAAFGAISLPDRIVGYPTDQMDEPEPELVRTSIDGTTVPVHWLTLLPAQIEQRLDSYSDIVYDSQQLDELGTLLIMTEDPGDTAAIETKRAKLMA